MSKICKLIILSIFLVQINLSAEAVKSGKLTEEEKLDEGHSFLVGTLLYLPNRVFDIFDIFRMRARVGPGLAVGVRATRPVSAFVGTYASVFAGLPGPRLAPGLPIPVGLESLNGLELSFAEASVSGGIGPDYSASELGLSFHLLIFGFDFGFDPVEVVDCLLGFFTIDLREDDF